ncbi:MAG: aspartate-semialdehyde dehydrogenase [Gammaproteobacteria bacterium]|nr:MAG: aspartate-semialdehyde dehydrogenase [Gammaproteobacteria bacterium]
MSGKNGLHVAVVGATGLVGELMLELLYERQFPAAQVTALASQRSQGKTVTYGAQELDVQALADFDFRGVDIALFSAGGDISKEFAPKAMAAGAIVIDNTSAFRYEPNIPLVIPEVNPEALASVKPGGAIIANPNCSTIQMLLAVKPIYDRYGVHSIDVATYQSVSGMGRRAVEGLARQCALLLNGRPIEEDVFGRQMAFNVVPHIDEMLDNGYSREEMKMVWETRKILNDPSIEVNPTAVRVPVFFGHSEAVHIRTEEPVSVDDVRSLLADAPGVEVVDALGGRQYATAVEHASGKDPVFVSRIRPGVDDPYRINLWVVADNVRKGAALNSIQIAELLVKTVL